VGLFRIIFLTSRTRPTRSLGDRVSAVTMARRAAGHFIGTDGFMTVEPTIIGVVASHAPHVAETQK
jgi:hypothetical protein